ncbi:MAG: zinc ribbon domain-containing protein [Candidatus Dadabacteria bacterium]|nr:zinc ribbon domain-containing protein [Candidatus Dadabacteria bacterium]NIS08342.1 zinc ribbon domain-containing protein [Candidatus Dadabacteria bacterium]NIV43120.1 zinc ribbon domain-containing protein [Candidatus Dadabacteria bacterium]NIX14734.1 zinc ribbon domain-containing protein [Candidatus Dadabacteria bacterium]NIY22251.1 zinc ribbon domain-containing protein [Candidatus Dadabacteria bacterium]
MPIYEYECEKCGAVFEEFQSFSDEPIKKCKICKKGKVQKLISLSSFQLTGSGWYSTDYVKGPGIPPKAADQANPAVTNPAEVKGANYKDSATTMDSIKKATKKTRSKKSK